MNEVVSVSDVQNAYAYLSGAIVAVQEKSQQVVETKRDLTLAKTAALLDGSITGKNQAERDAKSFTLLEPYHLAVSNAEDELVKARGKVELAHLEVDRLKLLERITRQ